MGILAVAAMTVAGTQVASSQQAQGQNQPKSSAVTVTNTPLPVTVTNPAPVDQSGRIAYQSIQSVSPCGPVICSFAFPAVPARHRLVLQSVSGVVDFSNTPNAIQVGVFDGQNSPGVAAFFAPFVLSRSVFVQPLLLFVEGQPIVNVQLLGGGANPQGSVTLSGYLLDCAASPCAPISQ